MMMTRAGSSDAFGELVERHHDRLAFYIGQVLGDTESAEDLAQETFLRAYRARARYVPKAKWTTWLRKIARNLYLDERRRRYNTSTQSLDDMRIRVGNTVTFPLYDVLPDLRTPSIETSMVDDEEVDAVRQHIDNLSPKHGQVLKMRVYDEMNYREISDVLGCSLGTVKSRIHYAVRELRSVMAEAAAE
jgi:RNA polymerase sigma-70 factor (ECF subfamily)